MRFLSPLLLRAGAALLFIIAVLSACTVVVDEDSGGPPIGPGPLCTREYDPVCARRGGDRQTFANACLADQAGYRIVRRGECRRDDDGGGGGFCTQEYDPVCARRGGERRTFSNSCMAERAGYRVIRGGECRRDDGDDDDNGGGFCTREYAPVCARSRNGGPPRTFPNSCEAESAGYRIIGTGPC
jgi:hypothetical protein